MPSRCHGRDGRPVGSRQREGNAHSTYAKVQRVTWSEACAADPASARLVHRLALTFNYEYSPDQVAQTCVSDNIV